MPPLAQTNPCAVSVISTPFCIRTTRRASRRTTSTWRGSRSKRSANLIASRRGVTVVRSTTAPSAFDTIFWVTTSTSSRVSGNAPAVRWIALPMKTPRSSPSRISGIPSSARIRIDASADTEALRLGGFDEDEVLGGVEVDRQRAADLGVGGVGGLGGGAVVVLGFRDRTRNR